MFDFDAMLQNLLDRSPVLAGVVACLILIWRLCHRTFDHMEKVAARQDEAELRCLEQMAKVAEPATAAIARNSEVLELFLDRAGLPPSRGNRWRIQADEGSGSMNDMNDDPELIELDNPNNEPVYGIPPGERIPEVTYRDADKLAESRDWGHKPLGIAELHDRGIDGAGVIVAVLDTGLDQTHPGLSGQIVAARDYTGSPSGSSDRQGHGTHCGGVIAEKADGLGLRGVAPGAKLWIGKVLSDRGSGLSSWIARGIREATAAGVDVISMSLGGPQPDGETKAAIQDAYVKGVWVACAAGNDGPGQSSSYPGNYPEVACVAAVGQEITPASFSSRNAQVDIAAPGVSVLSTYPGGRYASLSGTSMATPYAAGVLALARSELKKRGLTIPKMDVVLRLLKSTARDISPAGVDIATGGGLIQPAAFIDAMLKFAAPTPAPTPTPAPIPTPNPTPTPAPVRGRIVLTSPELTAAGFASLTLEPVVTRDPSPAIGEDLIPPPIRAILRVLLPIIRRIAGRTDTPVDDLIVKIVELLLANVQSGNLACVTDGESIWGIIAKVLRVLMPILKEIAAKTETTIDDLILKILESLIMANDKMRRLSTFDVRANAVKIARDGCLLGTQD